MALLNNSAQINIIILDFVKNCSFDVVPLSYLVGGWVACIGMGSALTQPMGYIVIQVQVDGVQGYDEDQIALGIPDFSHFTAWVPVILGTPTISHIVNVVKEKEIDALAMPCANAQVAYLLAVWGATATVEDGKFVAGESDPSEYVQVVITKDTETFDAFSSCIIHERAGTAYTSVGLNVMTQALHIEKVSLPQGLTAQNTYTELFHGSKNITMVVRNSMAYPQTLRKKTPVVMAVMATRVPEPPMQTGVIEVLDEVHSLQAPRLTMKHRQKKLFEALDLSALESSPPELADSAHSLLSSH